MNPQTKATLKKYFPYYKWTVYGLLGIDMLYYFVVEHNFEAAQDNFGWLLLLLSFEWETSQLDHPYTSKFEKYGVIGMSIVGYLIVIAAAIEYSMPSYYLEEGTLDIWNSWTWLALCAVLEYDVYYPGLYARWEWYVRNGLKVFLYGALTVYAVLWGLQGEFLDFWDAFLWILCFFSIEMNILDYEENQPFEEDIKEQNQQKEIPKS